MTDLLNDKVAIVTGTGSVDPGWGNGKAISVLFAREGAKVFSVDIDRAAAEETRRIVESEGGACAVHAADVSKGAEVEALVGACTDTFGRVDVLVNNASIAALGWCGVNYGYYAATKRAIVSMTRSIGVQSTRVGIRANCLLPGLMNTPMVHAALTRVYGEEGDIDTLIKTRDAQCPMGHMGDAWDTAYAALYLASDEAKYVTATEFFVDGGLTRRFV